MKRYFFYILFISAELLLIIGIIVLGIKIKNLQNGKVRGVQHVTVIKKENLIFDEANHNLKYFYESKPNTVKKEHPEWLRYETVNTINSDSLNERKDYKLNKDSDVYRIITLRDSFTYGIYVNTPENYSEVLEDLLNSRQICRNIHNFEVINFGVGAYDIEYMVERFVKRGIKYQPDLIIWLLHEWDFKIINEYKIPLEQELIKKGIPYFDSNSGLYTAGLETVKELQKRYTEDEIIRYQKQVLSRMNQNYKKNLLLISFPSLSQKYKDVIKEFIKLDPHYFFYDNVSDIYKNNTLHLADGHPNKEGHKKIAEDIFEYLKKNILTNCN